ncbi:MAG: FmdE family protein [Chloroflexota bacterium]
MSEQTQQFTPDIDAVVRFHGHFCPGIALGIRAAQIALREIGSHSADEEVVAIVETDMCAVDAIQYMVGCTFGKGNLIHLDYGKNAYTFIRRSDGKAIRILSKPGVFGKDPERASLMARADAGQATAEEQARFQEMQNQWARAVLTVPEEELYTVQRVEAKIPSHARLRGTVACEVCGEPTMETRTRRMGGKTVCIPCFEQMESRY